MPLYTYKCGHCGSRRDVMLKIAELDVTEVKCPRCSQLTARVLSAPMVKGDLPGYDCPITGKWIEGRRAHEENLAKHGCRVYEAGETQQFTQRKAQDEAQFEERVAETAEKFVHELPTQKREKLIEELNSGADVAIQRKTGTEL